MNEIIANEGMWLTQASLDNERDRIFAKRLYPAASLSASDFVEYTDAQKAAWERVFVDMGGGTVNPYKITPLECAYYLNGNCVVYESEVDNTDGNVLCDIEAVRITNSTLVFTATQILALKLVLMRLTEYNMSITPTASLSAIAKIQVYIDGIEQTSLSWTSFMSNNMMARIGSDNAMTLQASYADYFYLYPAGQTLFSGAASARIKITYTP